MLPLSTPAHTGFLPFAILFKKARLWVGLAALLTWVDLLFCFEGVLRDTVTEQGGLVHDPVFMGATLTAGCVLMLAGHTRVGASFLGRRPLVGAALVGALCSAAGVILTAMAEHATAWIPYVLGGVIGVVIAVLTVAWGTKLADLDLREALLVVSLAACAQWVLPAAVAGAGYIVRLLSAVAAPLIAGWALGDARVPQTPQPQAARPPATLWRLSAALFVFSLVAQLVWCFFIKGLPGRLDPGLFSLVFVVVGVSVAIVAGGCAALMERQARYRIELYYRVAFLVCLAGVGAMGVAAADLTQPELFASYAAVYVGYSVLGPTMWMLALGYIFMQSAPVQQVVGLVFGGQYLGLFAGFGTVQAFLATGAIHTQILGPLVVLLGIAALGIAYTALFPERSLLALSPRLFGLSPASLEERCNQVASRYALTPRETEVFLLLARGRDVGFICDALGIARNTVNVHRKGIYAKLNIHSQQELLSVVEQAGGEEERP